MTRRAEQAAEDARALVEAVEDNDGRTFAAIAADYGFVLARDPALELVRALAELAAARRQT